MKIAMIVTWLSLATPPAFALNWISPKFKTDTSLIQNVALSDHDTRGSIVDKAAELGLTVDDVEQIRGSYGHVYCPGSYTPEELKANKSNTGKLPPPANRALLGGVLVEGSDVLLTNWHAFVDDKGNPRDPLSKCVFMNQALPKPTYVSIKLADGAAGLRRALRAGDMLGGTAGSQDGDRVVVKLVAPLTNVRPFKVHSESIQLYDCPSGKDCQQMVLVSAQQLRMPGKVVGQQDPIVQSCEIRDLFPESDGHGPVALANCSETEGASGSLGFLKGRDGQFVRSVDGELLPFALLKGGNSQEADGLPYSIEPGPRLNAAKLLVIDRQLETEILIMAGKKLRFPKSSEK